MVSGKYSAVAGAISREQAIANISENLANVSTTGYKRGNVSFESLLRGEKQKTDAEGINYTRIGQNTTDFAPGPMKDTGNPTDIAIHGTGFFKVRSEDGIRFTRRGDFQIGADEVLRTKSGMPVLNDADAEIIVAGSQTGRVSISQLGTVTLINDDGTSADIGRIGIVDITDPSKLKKEEHTTFSLEPGAQEIPIEEPTVLSGALESSNVNMVEEMTKMIASYRTFETYHKVIQSYSDISDKQAELGTLS